MSKIIFIILTSILFPLLIFSHGFSLNNEDIIRLKKAAISEKTIELMIREKVTETCAFTVQEILDLKEAGLSDRTIQILIKEGSFLKSSEPVIYGKDIRHIKFTTAKDIIELKSAGVCDEVIQAIIVFGSRDADDIEREKAWDLLENMGIIVDMREDND
ncbi:MAG: hypothetical protein JSV50_11325 [Desulfobacteraceae bacterium]|nr:MAG: hypothetical protein JSV50_11325 [Desulfobacteraceae bacterium]